MLIKNLHRSSGFTLVEIMMVAAGLGGLALVGMQMTKTQTKSAVKATFDSEKLLISNEINGILSDPEKCRSVFASTASPTNIYGKYFTKPSGSAPAQGYGNANIDINSYTLSGTAPDGILTIAYNKKSILKGASGTADAPFKINLYMEGSPGAITKCRSVSTGLEDIWKKGDAANIADIFFSSGKVGIGTATPSTRLDVDGEIRPGSVGISLGGNCVNEGAFAYDLSAHTPVYCNNDSPIKHWAAMGGGGTGGVLSIYGYRASGTAGIWNVANVTTNTLLTSPPPKSIITIEKAGNYLAVSTSYLCVSGAAGYMSSFVVHNGTYVATSVNDASECASSSATVGLNLAVGDTVEGRCAQTQPLNILCTLTLIKI